MPYFGAGGSAIRSSWNLFVKGERTILLFGEGDFYENSANHSTPDNRTHRGADLLFGRGSFRGGPEILSSLSGVPAQLSGIHPTVWYDKFPLGRDSELRPASQRPIFLFHFEKQLCAGIPRQPDPHRCGISAGMAAREIFRRQNSGAVPGDLAPAGLSACADVYLDCRLARRRGSAGESVLLRPRLYGCGRDPDAVFLRLSLRDLRISLQAFRRILHEGIPFGRRRFADDLCDQSPDPVAGNPARDPESPQL